MPPPKAFRERQDSRSGREGPVARVDARRHPRDQDVDVDMVVASHLGCCADRDRRCRFPPPATRLNRHEHVTKRRVFPGYLRDMDEARAVLDRLERIEALEANGAPSSVLLDEVRGLLAEAEVWVRAEPAGTDLAETALERFKEALHHAETSREAGAGLC